MFFRSRGAAIRPGIVRSVARPAKRALASHFARDLRWFDVTTRDMQLAVARAHAGIRTSASAGLQRPGPPPKLRRQIDGARGAGRADAAPALRHPFLEGLSPTLPLVH